MKKNVYSGIVVFIYFFCICIFSSIVFADDTSQPAVGGTTIKQAADLYAKGMEYSETDYHKALDYLRQALNKDPDYLDALLEAGRAAGLVGLNDEAQKLLDKALTLLKERKLTGNEKYAQYLFYRANLFFQNEDPGTARDYVLQAMQLLEKLKSVNNALYAKLLVRRSILAQTENRLDAALDFTDKAEAVAQKLNTADKNKLLYAINNLRGNIYCTKGKPGTATEYFLKAKAFLEKQGLSHIYDMALVYNNLGWAQYLQHNYGAALKNYAESEKILTKLKLEKTRLYVILLQNFANSHFQKREFHKSLTYSLEAKAAMENTGRTSGIRYAASLYLIAITYHNLALPGKDQNRLSAALEYYSKAMQAYDALSPSKGDKNTYRIILHNMGKIYYMKSEPDKAEHFYLQAKSVMEKQGWNNTTDYGYLLYDLAALYEVRGQKAKAGSYYRQAYSTFEKSGYTGTYKTKALQNAKRLGR